MGFSFKSVAGKNLPWAPGKIVCVGRNYLEHINELQNEVPDDVVLFMKPNTAFSALCQKCEIPANKGEIHYECELALLISKKLSGTSATHTLQAIGAYGLALDLTLRGLQSRLKAKGLPWEKAKAFDGSCPISPWKMVNGDFSLAHQYVFRINGNVRQSADTRYMLTDIAQLLAEISGWFTLMPGDVVLTGTPAGVGKLSPGDQLEFILDGQELCQSRVGYMDKVRHG